MSTSPHTTQAMGALPAAQRIATLDILRGFALMGILVMNMPGFSTSFFAEADGSHLWSGPVDRAVEELRDMLFSGKFNSMFSLLFGLGFALQYGRLQQRVPLLAGAIYLRRLLVLLAIGVAHSLLLWPGDVLHTYALLGLVLLFGLRRVSDRGLVALMAACLLWPLVSGLLRVAFITQDITASRVKMAQALEASNNLAYGAGSYAQVMAENLRVMSFFYDNPLSLWNAAGWYVMLALTMLMGLLAGRRQWVQRAGELMPQIRTLTWWALGVGLLSGAAFTAIFAFNRVPGPSLIKTLGGICYSLSRVALMVFYVLVIVRLAQHPGTTRWLAPMAAAGRLPLTNYLMQSLICTAVFYGWGLGLWGKVGPAAGFALALGLFFLVQVPWSMWWLKHHERGPVEALWARLTYGEAASAHAQPELRVPR